MRHSQILARDNSLLLVVDFQEKLLAAFKETAELLENCAKLIRFAKILNLPIIWTEQYPKGLGTTADMIKAELSGSKPVVKLSFSCFGEPKFLDALSKHSSRQLIVCGIETHICVAQTALDGIEAGYQMHVVADACSSRKKHDHEIALQKMSRAGGILTCTESSMYEILERSDAREFKEVLKLVR